MIAGLCDRGMSVVNAVLPKARLLSESPKETARAGMTCLLNVEEEAQRGADGGRPGPAPTVSAPR